MNYIKLTQQLNNKIKDNIQDYKGEVPDHYKVKYITDGEEYIIKWLGIELWNTKEDALSVELKPTEKIIEIRFKNVIRNISKLM